jgi:CRP/FNR family transcriptional regulator, cyclic AMP receptor protein
MTSRSSDTLETLQSVEFLNQLPPRLLAKLVPLTSVEVQSAGSVLFREADRFDRLLIVVKGLVALEMHVLRRGAIRALTVGPGEVLAWSAVLGDQSMTVTATVLDPAELISIPASSLKELCVADREIGYAIMERMAIALSRRLLATRLQLLDLFGDSQPVARTNP